MSESNDARQLPLFQQHPQRPEDIYRKTPLKHTFDLFQDYLYTEGKSEHTVKAFTGDLHLFGEFEHNDKRPIGEFETRSLEDFLQWMEHGRGVPCSQKTYARRVTTLKVFFKWLYELKAIPHDPAKAVLQRSGQAPLSDALTETQIRAVIYAARTMRFKKTDMQDYRPELLLRLLIDTGIKKNEAMALTPENIDRTDPKHPTVMIKTMVRNVFKERKIALDADWLTLLDLYIEQYDIRETIFNCTARNLEYILTDIGERAELPFKLSFEVLRWTSGLRDYRSGMTEDLIREKLGLSEISWHETGSKIRKLAEKLDEVG